MDGIGCDGLAGDEGEAGTLGESGEQKVTLHHGEVLADADAWACAERQVGVARELLLSFGCEAFRLELLRLWEVLFATVQGVGCEQDNPVFGNAIAINLDITYGTAREGIGRWVEPHGFFEDL